MIQTAETDSALPAVPKKLKAAVVPKEEAVSDEEFDESGITDDLELKALQVHPSSIVPTSEFASSSKDIKEPSRRERKVASQSAPDSNDMASNDSNT